MSRLPLGECQAYALNLLAGLMAAASVVLVGYLASRLPQASEARNDQGSRRSSADAGLLGIAVACVALSCSHTLWQYATRFTPYVLTVLLTSMILWAMMEWWDAADRAAAPRWLALTAFLFGLDLSVHRTNLLMLPGLAAWVALRHPGTLRQAKTWLLCGVGMVAGLAFHLLTIPIAGRRPPLNFGNPCTLPRLWDYVSLQSMAADG